MFIDTKFKNKKIAIVIDKKFFCSKFLNINIKITIRQIGIIGATNLESCGKPGITGTKDITNNVFKTKNTKIK